MSLAEQREIAQEIVDRGNTLASHEDGAKTWTVWDAAHRLAELVLAEPTNEGDE